VAFDLRTDALAVLKITPPVLENLLGGVPEHLVDTPLDEGWSPKDVVAHLLLSEEKGAIGRIRAVVTSDLPTLQDFDEKVELDRSGFRDRTWAELLNDFTLVRLADTEWLVSLSPHSFARRGFHTAVGGVTAEELLCHAAYHDALHLRQLVAMLQCHFEPHRGVLRAF
jgi:hypothetical protein